MRSNHEIAGAFLVPRPTMAQRLSRAKQKIREAGIPFRIPEEDQIQSRLGSVLAVIYLIFNEGYKASEGVTLIRTDLSEEAIRLQRVLVEALRSEVLLEANPEVLGLLALMLLHDSRRSARVSPDNKLVLLEDQDRSLWNHAAIEEGTALLEKALHTGRSGPYQIQAAISAVHSEARRAEETDWPQIVELYRSLEELQPTPVIRVNRAIAIGMAGNLNQALKMLDELEADRTLSGYVSFHAAKADLHRRKSDLVRARRSYREARDRSQNQVERAYFERRLSELEDANGH